MHSLFCGSRKLKKEDGFLSLVIILIVFTTLIIAGLTAYFVYYKRVNEYLNSKQQKQFTYLSNNINTFYYENAYQIEQNQSNVLQTNAGTFANYQQLANYLGLPQTDAWNNPYIMYVSNRLTDNVTGNYYHLVYIVSLGSSHKLQSTFNQSTGVLTLGGTNMAIEINGKDIEDKIYLQNATQLSNLARKIQGFVKSLYIANNKQGTDYFYNSQDSTCQNIGLTNYGSGLFGCYQGTAIGNTNLPSVMDLGNNEYTNTLGQQFVFDNSSSNVVSQPPAGQTSTIYTARVGVLEPSGSIQWLVFTYL